MCVSCCSEGDGDTADGVMVYYQSDFTVPEPRVTLLDEAMESLDEPEKELHKQGRLLVKPTNTLNVRRLVSGGTPTDQSPTGHQPPTNQSPTSHQFYCTHISIVKIY